MEWCSHLGHEAEHQSDEFASVKAKLTSDYKDSEEAAVVKSAQKIWAETFTCARVHKRTRRDKDTTRKASIKKISERFRTGHNDPLTRTLVNHF
jgi:hypothetical protein